MKFSTILAFAATAIAAPTYEVAHHRPCLDIDRAYYLVSRVITFLGKQNITESTIAGAELYADDFVQYGDSINSLRGDPLGTLVEPNGTSYRTNTLAAPPIPSITTLAVLFNCTHIFWQWRFLGVGGPNAPVKNRINGFTLITVDPARVTQPIIEQYVEFNSFAWAENTGFNISFPTTGTFAPERK